MMDTSRRAQYCIFLCGLFGTVKCSAPGTLRQAQILFRHGDRSIHRNFPGMPDQRDVWPNGLDQLTQLGMQQMEGLGKYFRTRYDGFLNSTYVTDEVYVRSTDTDRSLMSASVLLAGLYPPQGAQVWSSQLPWQPVPVHTQLEMMDYKLGGNSECPAYEDIRLQALAAENKRTLDEYPEVIDELSQHVKDISLQTVWEMADALHCMRLHPELGLMIPSWMKPELEQWLYRQMDQTMGKVTGYTHKMLYLKTGPYWNMVTDKLRSAVNNDSPQKLHLYSAHDITMTVRMQSLGIWNQRNPPYGSALILELHEPAPSQFVLQVYFKNDTHLNASGDPLPVTIPGCVFSCPLERFLELTEAYSFTGSIEEWKSICGVQSEGGEGTIVGTSILIAVLSFCLVVCIFWITFLKLQPAGKTGYSAI